MTNQLTPAPTAAHPALPPALTPSVMDRVLAEAARGRYDRAIDISRTRGAQEPDVLNARGVCLLRVGRVEDAVALFRSLVLNPGCTWMRRDRPMHFKTNFATALLMAGHPSGCLEILAEAGVESPEAARLRAAIKSWEATLPFWPWVNWKTSRIEPPHRPAALGFPPGDFGPAAPVALRRDG